MGFGIPKAVSLASRLVSDKNHWDRLGVEFLPFVVVDPGPASENAEVGNVRDATSEGLIWCSPFKQFSWASVDHVNGNGECFDPEAVLHPGMMDTGGKGSITQWVHVEYMEGSETICPTFTQWVRGGYFSKVPTKVPTG